MAENEFEVKSAEEIEQLSDEDQTKYETDLADYTEKNLESQLENQDIDADEDEVETEEAVEAELETETVDEDIEEIKKKANRYDGLSPKLSELAEENRLLKEKLEAKPEEIVEQKIFDPEHHRDLLDSDPEKAADYYYDHYVKPRIEQENTKTTQAKQMQDAQELTVKSINEFSKLEDVVRIMETKPELGDAFGKYLSTEVQPPRGGYKVEDLQKQWKRFRVEDIIQETEEKTKRETIAQLNDANPDVITLTNAKDSKTVGTNLKKLNREQAAELGESMDEEKLEKLLDERLG